MNGRHVPVTLPRARFDVDTDGHVTVSVDGQPWQPLTGDPAEPANLGTVRLGRSVVLWAQQLIANELGTPVLVEVVEGGRTYSDVIDPDNFQATEPPDAQAASEVGEGPYAPGEPVVISVVIDRTHADEHGHVRYRLPTALGGRTVLVQGEKSQTTLPLDLVPRPEPQISIDETASRPPVMGPGTTARRPARSGGHTGRPDGPTPGSAHRDTPDVGLGAL